ncbi:MAG TPA: hypothetical protein VFI31_24925 [Pirellulales bacterium]|nr:hypothetical protein [Pirellulales bacterium]
MIHCDEVFDILTRGPFPTGAASDGIVEAHLNHCDACRQLAEALRPAIELLQEAIAPEECDGLPRYGGAAAARSVWSDHAASGVNTKQLVARPVVARVAASIRRQTVAWPWRSAAKFAAAACIGLALAGMLRQMVLSRDALGRAASPPTAVAASWRAGLDGRQWAARQGLTESCRQWVEGFSVVTAPDQTADKALQFTCCARCHAANSHHRLPAGRVSGFVLACQACH